MKKWLLPALTLAAVLSLTACSKTRAPSVTPSPSPSAVTPSTEVKDDRLDDGTLEEGKDHGLVGDIGDDLKDMAEDVGDAVGDTAKDVERAAKNRNR